MATVGVVDKTTDLEELKPEVEEDYVVEEADQDDAIEDIDSEEQWSSRWSFILAAIGSAIGLGNFWRFPFLAYRWGGGAFFIPYLIALFLVGIPLIQLEMAIGQVFRRATVQAFGQLDPRLRGLGLACAWISFALVVYYTAILAWGNVMMAKSFYSVMPWDIRGLTGTDVVTVPTDHFGAMINMAGTLAEVETISLALYVGLIGMWGPIYFILVRGQGFISKAVWVTVLLPVVMLAVLLVVGFTLPGAGMGVTAYIGTWDMTLLSNSQMWTDAFSQIFFSLSLGFGVMSAYGSLNPRNSDVIKDGAIVAICNCSFSFMAGFAVFTIVGFFAQESGYESVADFAKPPEEGGLGASIAGSRLAFVTYPAALSLIGPAAGKILSFLFFVTFFFLGVDSAFSLVDAVVLNLRETVAFAKWTRGELVSIICVFGFVISVFFVSEAAGLMDFVDEYAVNGGLLLVGFIEAVTAGWIYNKAETVEKAGVAAVAVFDGGYFLASFAMSFVGILLPACEVADKANETSGQELGACLLDQEDIMHPTTVLLIAAGIFVAGAAFSILGGAAIGSANCGGFQEALYVLGLSGPDALRFRLNRVITKDAPNNWSFSKYWALNVKFLIVPLMTYLNLSRLNGWFAGKGVYREPGNIFDSDALQILFSFCYLIMPILIIIGIVSPGVYRDPHTVAK